MTNTDDGADRNSQRDHPLSCHWRPVAPDALDFLGLPSLRSKLATIARGNILTEAFVVGRAHPDTWISYSRAKMFYTSRAGHRYWPTAYSYRSIVPIGDQLAAEGLLDHERMPAGHRGWQSRFKASPELLRRFNEMPLAIVHDPRELIVLRDHDRKLIDYVDTRQTDRMRRHLQSINEVILGTEIELRGHVIRDGDLLQVGKAIVGAASSKLHRVFNRGSFEHGGRLYGGWWQNIPSASRADISVNGAGTTELDYPQLHPTLLYAMAGRPMRGDPYDLADWPRDLVKLAFNALVNADTRQAAVRAIASEIGGSGAYARANNLVGTSKNNWFSRSVRI